MKRDFYVFLDIDGVLWDWKWRKEQINLGLIKKPFSIITNFKPESMQALNYLIENLNARYNCKLVISSSWRYMLERAKQTLIKNGLTYDQEILATDTNTPLYGREFQILRFLKSRDEKCKYLIIDDTMFGYDNHFCPQKVIRTNIFNNSLNMTQVISWLKVHNLYKEKSNEMSK